MANTKEKEYFFQQQGLKSFVKAKMDWAGISKIHLSFVSHEGANAGYKQQSHIEAALKTDGPAKEHALYFAEAVLNGRMEARRMQALQKQQQTGAKYAEALFESNGGSPARPDRPCMWRVVRLTPGNKAEYVLSAMEAEGEVNQKGGYSKKEGAAVSRIDVAFSTEELFAFASSIKMAWQAHLVALAMTSSNEEKPEDADMEGAPDTMEPSSGTSECSTVYVVYDTLGELFETAITPTAALALVQEAITVLRKSEARYKRKTNQEYESAKAAILNDCEDIPSISLQAADDPNNACEVIVVRRTPRK